jgi:hypothetical protein
MTEAHPAHWTGGASRDDEGAMAALGLAEWLCLAATPRTAMRETWGIRWSGRAPPRPR